MVVTVVPHHLEVAVKVHPLVLALLQVVQAVVVVARVHLPPPPQRVQVVPALRDE